MDDGFLLSDGPLLFDRLEEQKSDSLLQLIALCDADPRPDKIDVGVGVYRDSAGGTPILRAVKKAERLLWERQETKAYLGSQGDARFTELIRPIVFGEAGGRSERIVGLQTPGGCGALRLGADLVAKANPAARIFVGQPTWPNHGPLIASRRGRDGAPSLLRPAEPPDPVRRDDGGAGDGARRRPRPPPRLLPQSDRRRPLAPTSGGR